MQGRAGGRAGAGLQGGECVRVCVCVLALVGGAAGWCAEPHTSAPVRTAAQPQHSTAQQGTARHLQDGEVEGRHEKYDAQRHHLAPHLRAQHSRRKDRVGGHAGGKAPPCRLHAPAQPSAAPPRWVRSHPGSWWRGRAGIRPASTTGCAAASPGNAHPPWPVWPPPAAAAVARAAGCRAARQRGLHAAPQAAPPPAHCPTGRRARAPSAAAARRAAAAAAAAGSAAAQAAVAARGAPLRAAQGLLGAGGSN